MPTLSATTPLPFETFQARLEDEFARSVAAGALTRTWMGQTVRIEGAGCRGAATFDAGRISGPIELGLPWSLMRNRILDEIARVFRQAGCDQVRIDL
jgi:hypothetical protein